MLERCGQALEHGERAVGVEREDAAWWSDGGGGGDVHAQERRKGYGGRAPWRAPGCRREGAGCAARPPHRSTGGRRVRGARPPRGRCGSGRWQGRRLRQPAATRCAPPSRQVAGLTHCPPCAAASTTGAMSPPHQPHPPAPAAPRTRVGPGSPARRELPAPRAGPWRPPAAAGGRLPRRARAAASAAHSSWSRGRTLGWAVGRVAVQEPRVAGSCGKGAEPRPPSGKACSAVKMSSLAAALTAAET